MKSPLITISGPTACGKTAVSVELAKIINGEIISADSMQVYKYMDIGTAKITEKEKQGIKHYLIDALYPDEEFSIAVFQKMAKEALSEIYDKGKMPILVGGTGFYVNGLIYDNDFTPGEKDDKMRLMLEKDAAEKGNEYVHNILRELDPEYAETVHPNNVKRVIRAIEFCRDTGEKFSEYNARERLREPAYDVKSFILNMDRDLLYERIEKRIDIMLKNGLVEEVKGLMEKYSENLVSMKGLGYKEIIGYLNGEYSLEEAIYILKRDTRHFARRQLTWFKHQSNGMWINMQDYESPKAAAEFIAKEITKEN